MAFRFKRATCVVAGTFNMYIVQPSWLVNVGILPKPVSGVTILSKLDEPGFRFSSPALFCNWFVTPSRIEVDTYRPDEDCGEKVAAVLRALPWTPLVALGNNATYTAAHGELQSLPAEFRRTPDIASGYSLTQTSFHFGLSREERVFNLQLSITPDELELSINVQTELRERNSEAAQAAARYFLQDRRDAEALTRQLFKASIENGNPNPEPA